MSLAPDDSTDPGLLSWVESANHPASDFPLQNLPYGRFRSAAQPAWRIGVAIGSQVLDLQACGLLQGDDLGALMAAGPAAQAALRCQLSQGLRAGSAQQASWAACLQVPRGSGHIRQTGPSPKAARCTKAVGPK